MQNKKNQVIPSLNGLRAISIILVILSHLSANYIFFDIFKDHPYIFPIFDLLTDGGLGVNIFFVISGFLITTLMIKEEIANNKISLKSFYFRRILRIFPAYYFLLSIYFILQLFGVIVISNESWLTVLTHTKYFNWCDDWLTGHFWSLSIEAHFYLLWPVLFVLGKKYRKAILVIILFLIPLFRRHLDYNCYHIINELTLFTRVDSIALGCLIAFYKDNIITIIKPYWRLLVLISTITLLFIRYFPISSFENYYMQLFFNSILTTHGTIANICVAIIILYSIYGNQGIWFKILNNKIISYIGMLSFSLYLWQQIFLNGTKAWIIQFPQNILFLIIISIFSFHFIEKPFHKFKK